MPGADILVVCEAGRGQGDSANTSLLATGASLAEQGGGRLVCLLVGHDIAAAAQDLSRYADEVHVADSPRYADFDSRAYANVAKMLAANLAPAAVLFGHTYIGMDVAPRLALKLSVSVAPNCFDVMIEDGTMYFLRPMYRGRLHAKVTTDARPAIATLQQSGSRQPVARSAGRIIAIEGVGEADPRARPVRTVTPERTGIDITKADIIVSGGRGIGERENFVLIDDLAAALGGVPACSRPLVDMGWFTTSSQVGLSGVTVKPKLYVACGISGAVEHLHGMKESGTIVAINKDPEAPIFKVADFGIVGDLMEILPLLTTEVRDARAAVPSASHPE
jgi:electron transfer flavoprotein alpha subunit